MSVQLRSLPTPRWARRARPVGPTVDGAAVRPATLRPGTADREALWLWLLSRITVFAVAAAGGWLFARGDPTEPTSFTEQWRHWDVVHFVTIAEHGYSGDPVTGPQVPLEAFFPGLPLLLRVFGAIGVDLVVAGLVISFLAGAVTVVALARLAVHEAGRVGGPAQSGGSALAARTVLLFVLAPSAVFLAAGYTESLFLAFALPAWLAARRGRWGLAAGLAAGASTVRVSGVFLAAALAVEFLTAGDGRRRWRALPWLAVPLVPVAAYFTYLYQRTGDWLAWKHAQEQGWSREFTWPWDSLATTWQAATGGGQSTGFAWMFGAEIVAVAVGLALTGWLITRRRWGEVTYVGAQVAAFTTSTWFFSVPRATLLWWPLWIALAAATLRRPRLLHLYLAVIAPFMVVFTLLFTTGRWAG